MSQTAVETRTLCIGQIAVSLFALTWWCVVHAGESAVVIPAVLHVALILAAAQALRVCEQPVRLYRTQTGVLVGSLFVFLAWMIFFAGHAAPPSVAGAMCVVFQLGVAALAAGVFKLARNEYLLAAEEGTSLPAP